MISDEKLKEFEEFRKLAMDGHVIKDVLDEVLPAIYAYKSKVEEMKKTLEWYADEKNWGSIEEYGAMVSDGGKLARTTLKGESQ